jgi:hypothetical protein
MSKRNGHDRYVYFIRQVGGVGPIKIGCSRNVGERLENLMIWSPMPLEVLAAAPGGYKLERNIQECFADLFSHKEWFHPGERLLKAIADLASGVPLHEAVNLNERRGRASSLPRVLPGTEGRRSYVMRMVWAEKKLPRNFEVPGWAWEPLRRWMRHGASHPPTEAQIALIEKFLSDPLAHAVERKVAA